MFYFRLPLQQLPSLSHGEFVLLTGQYFRHAIGDHLEQGDKRLELIGLPFNWAPPQGALVDIWGQLIQGQRLSLRVHNARPHTASGDVPEILPLPSAGQEQVLTVRVIDVGDCQFALTADGRSYALTGDELDRRMYCLHGHLLTHNPPTMAIIQAIPVLVPTPESEEPQL